ncbi:hypothetical protein [Streptomyces sp. WAC05374]|uniref:hypothetical protein n=1 Tax=Streptomyces sp. WAC05374 TaxID=2487420 RepID=UPI00190F9EA7|nr:hypothetical protein [Streptomyces sp. WAC05374]
MHAPRSTAVAATALTVAALTALGTATAHGHGGTLAVDIAGHEQGRVTARVTWENDRDSVDERVAATVNAVSADGRRTAGPWRLVRDPADDRRFTTAEALPPGRWKVLVEVGHPALGRDEADLTVTAAPARPPAAASPRPTSATTPAAAAEPAPAARPGTLAAAAGALLAVATAAVLAVRATRRRRS